MRGWLTQLGTRISRRFVSNATEYGLPKPLVSRPAGALRMMRRGRTLPAATRGNTRAVRGVGGDQLARPEVAVVRDDDFVVRLVEVDAVRIGHLRFRTAHRADRRVELLRVAPEDDVHVRRLHRERDHVAFGRERDAPRLMRNVQQPLRAQVAARAVFDTDGGFFNLVVT